MNQKEMRQLFDKEKHNRDVEMSDLLAEILEQYSKCLTEQQIDRIKKLAGEDYER